MAELYIDRITQLAADEDRGVMRSLTRVARIVFRGENAGDRNPDTLGMALDLLDAQGMGSMHTFPADLDPKAVQNRYGALVCTKRSPAIAENDPQCVDVTLKYEHLLDGHNQLLIPTPSGIAYGKGRTSIVEKSTNFFYPFGIVDEAKKTQIVVAHRFPDWDKRIVAIPYDPNFPRTIIQGGEVSIPFPQSNFHVVGLCRTRNPVLMARSIVATINIDRWMEEDPTKWICSECQWELNDPIDAGDIQPQYKVAFEFQFNFDGWDPTIAFHDNDTGRPPANIVAASRADTDLDDNGVARYQVDNSLPLGDPGRLFPAGIWQVPALRRIDFDTFFSALFDGA